MKEYKITHTTRYEYSDVVPFCQNIVLLTPRGTPWQTVGRHRLIVSPKPATNQKRQDYFGNTVHVLSVDTGHRLLQITASSTVQLSERDTVDQQLGPAWDALAIDLPEDNSLAGLADYQFTFRSAHVPFLDPLVEYARPSLPAGRPIIEVLQDLNQRIYQDFQYDPTATTVSTPVQDVLQSRRGVCQDLAHVMLGCLRPFGIAARYVSGYLRTIPPPGKERLVGADASHAWVSVFCGPLGWVDIDPTNNLFVATDHITVAWGRDYSDVCPVSGMFVGGGTQLLSVSVDVAPRDELSQHA